ncbi:hypothetical protein evm_010149 [Chilo suppressalis]|nr:hypothetical protein evm_010149 [Chilo suppressalis]
MPVFFCFIYNVFLFSECFGAQSDRSRHRSGPIRSVPVAANVKRDVDFDCPEEFGYYPHPSDCTLYYVCVFGGALLESCTGGLMYSHELQTCDWPRNVGCDGVSALGGEELERISERERDPPPPPPPPRRTPPPPPPRAQPNPVITSRGQPKFNREEYEKQQQLYAEVDDLPPVEEIESDRQQRVYRGQPSTIGQVQKDRDGYSQVSSGRNFNTNIIPASIPQNNGKIGSFSFGTQVNERRGEERRNNERRTATVTQAPQTYSEDKSDNVTDSHHDRQTDIATNEINVSEVIEKPILRKKRDVVGSESNPSKTNTTTDSISKRSSNDEEMEYVEFDTVTMPTYGDERNQDDSERGKRQIGYYIKNGYKIPAKNWGVPKQINLVDFRHLGYSPNIQNVRHPSNYDTPENFQRPSESSPLNSYQLYQLDNFQSQRPFKPSLPDPTKQKLTLSASNIATQIITKSPPISALKSNDNPFASLAGGFFNNNPKQSNHHDNRQFSSFYSSFDDALHLPSTVVTGKPTIMSTSTRTQNKHETEASTVKYNRYTQNADRPSTHMNTNQKPIHGAPPKKPEVSDDEVSAEEEESTEEDSSENYEDGSDHDFKHDFPEPPYEYTHYKFKDIENPFANPNFDFDSYLTKLSGGHYSVQSSLKPPSNQNSALKSTVSQLEITTQTNTNMPLRSSTLNYQGMSTPKPFNGGAEISSIRPSDSNQKFSSSTIQNLPSEQWTQRPQQQRQNLNLEQQQTLNQHVYQVPHQNVGIPIDVARPKLKPPNFKDDRHLPISYSFNRPLESVIHYPHIKEQDTHTVSVTQKPLVFLTGTGTPLLLSTPKQQYLLKQHATGKPLLYSSVKPQNSHAAYKQSTRKPLTTLANEQLAALQHYWGNPSPVPESYFSFQSSVSPMPSEMLKHENLFSKATRPTPHNSQNYYSITVKENHSSSTKTPPKRRPIPKPSPEMNDYYYDDDEEDEQYYYEPPVKSQYMPSSEVKPQRPPMAQNYKEYDDDEDQPIVHIKPYSSSRTPTRFTTRKPETITKNYNDVSVVTKSSTKDSNKNLNGKIPIPVLINYATPTSTVLIRPDISNYEILHHAPRNRTVHLRKPIQSDSSPFTLKPPKYLNQTTLRPYTVRHRLAKPTVSSQPISQNDDKPMRGRQKHQNIVIQIKHTTPRDNHNEETRYTKTKHDDRTNSLEPTENVTPVSYTASPRPKMLYNGSQTYNPDQYDPFYAVYDEDGELYKDTDYVQQYNTASLRPAVQQTYRGTPPPARRPVETYTPRPVPVDYDDALIQGQISNQNQYQSPIRHSTRGDGNELGYEHNPSSVKTTYYEATTISTTPSTTTSTSTTTTTQRTTPALLTEAMTPSRYTSRPSSTRGRGSAHYSTASDTPQPVPNRGTPPTRNRPTLKPSTAIVSKSTEFVDIYAHPPSRPAPVYPQPTPDKTAAKCRKDVCLLPDCYCGGRDIPGDMPVETVPQIVLLTFDDSVNDLNKGLYADLFEKGRVNPNGCPISATFYVSHEWTDYSQVQNLYSAGHEMASHTVSHSFGEQFTQKKWNREVGGQREILAAYGGVKLEDVRGMRAPFLSVGGNKMFKMLYDSNFTYDSSLPVYENRPPSWPYTLDYKLFHDCMIPPCPTKSYPGVWEVPMVMWQDLNGGRCSMGDACANPPEAEGVYKMILKNFDRHYTTNRAPFGLYYHAAWFTQPHHKAGFIMFLDFINQMQDVWIITNWQALQWVRDPTPISRLNNFQPFQCNYQDRPKKCNNPKVCNLWHKSGVRYMRTCQPCPEQYPWTGKTGIKSSRIDNEAGE